LFAEVKDFIMRELLIITKALADENRLRIVAALKGRELCLCQLVELLGLATSTVSRHASLLQQAQLVESRREGRWAYFRLADGEAPAVVQETLAAILNALDCDPQGKTDRQRLKEILKQDREELCRRQGKCKC
jgi:DNA-binding transcriptional ArsR family regulator